MIRLFPVVFFLAAAFFLSLSGPSARAEDNLISNGDFAANVDKWRLTAKEGAVATLATDSEPAVGNAAHIAVTQPGAQAYNVELQKDVSRLEAGNNYTLHFKAKSASPGQITIKLMINHAPYSAIWKGTTLDTGSGWQDYTMEVPIPSTPPLEDSSVLVVGGMGSHAGEYWLANFSLVKKD